MRNLVLGRWVEEDGVVEGTFVGTEVDGTDSAWIAGSGLALHEGRGLFGDL